ncbi:Uncharacterised protein [Vibrio cholerae]|uniref:Uncharacterized protein n=1 Tax=Vibrio cholerae TaxID=666 RepID=A0A655XHF0_VIBCL|nr:Uncharacterised protein [Vibrio cholerae]
MADTCGDVVICTTLIAVFCTKTVATMLALTRLIIGEIALAAAAIVLNQKAIRIQLAPEVIVKTASGAGNGDDFAV